MIADLMIEHVHMGVTTQGQWMVPEQFAEAQAGGGPQSLLLQHGGDVQDIVRWFQGKGECTWRSTYKGQNI